MTGAAGATRLSPTWADAHVTLARAQAASRKHVDAARSYTRALQLQPSHESALLELADVRKAVEAEGARVADAITDRPDALLARARQKWTGGMARSERDGEHAGKRAGLWGSLDPHDDVE
jgi:cytochrome c-type biogenesis protein CcmH/NrfG